jgi:MFS superfamily sulfate permease-like transporter
LLGLLRTYLWPFDARYEDLRRGNTMLAVARDLSAGAVVAMVAIPLAMGFAIASGLRPSKYQVYGPTAAFIPIIAAIMESRGFGFLVQCSILAGIVLAVLGLARLGRVVQAVPHSIVVGFTIGIAIVIALSQAGEIFGLPEPLGYDLLEKIQGFAWQVEDINPYALLLCALTFAITKYGIKLSAYLPAPLVALGVGTWLANGPLADHGLRRVRDEYGAMPTDFWVFTPPALPAIDAAVLFDLAYFTVAIVFVSGIESLLCSRMADRLADNRGTPFSPNKELWGQGMVQVIVPLLNGFPHTGALARTAMNIRLGAVSPLSGIFKCFIKLALAAWLASFLEAVPMACVAGVLVYVAYGMVKPSEVALINKSSRLDRFLMIYTAVMVPFTDFLTGVVTALLLWLVLRRLAERRP